MGKCIPGGTCTPGWGPLLYSVSVQGQKFLWWHKLKLFEVLSIIATVRSHGTGLFGLAVSVTRHFGHDILIHKQLYISLNDYRRWNVTQASVVPTPFEESWLWLNLNCNCDFEEFVFNTLRAGLIQVVRKKQLIRTWLCGWISPLLFALATRRKSQNVSSLVD